MRTLVVTGAAGGLGRMVVRGLLDRSKIRVVGVDRRNWVLDRPERFEFHQVDLRRSPAEDLFRTVRPWGIVHLAFVNDQSAPFSERHKINVECTQRVLTWAARYKAHKVVTLSRSIVYGAHPENPVLIDEGHPLKLGVDYPELSDLIEFDHLVRSFMWRHPETRTVLLRAVEVVGPNQRWGMLTRYMRLPRPPVAMGFNPMLQLIHEEDLAQAIGLALMSRAAGTFNVAGSGSVPLRRLLEELDIPHRVLPSPLLRMADRIAWKMGQSPFPPAAVDLLQYSCVVSDARIREQLRYKPQYGLVDTIHAIRRSPTTVLA